VPIDEYISATDSVGARGESDSFDVNYAIKIQTVKATEGLAFSALVVIS
jgi:hypothetical protein